MSNKAKSLRISLEHGQRRPEKVDAISEVFDCSKSKATMKAIEFTLEMIGGTTAFPEGNLERATNHPDMTPELAELLSSRYTSHTVERHTAFQVDE